MIFLILSSCLCPPPGAHFLLWTYLYSFFYILYQRLHLTHSLDAICRISNFGGSLFVFCFFVCVSCAIALVFRHLLIFLCHSTWSNILDGSSLEKWILPLLTATATGINGYFSPGEAPQISQSLVLLVCAPWVWTCASLRINNYYYKKSNFWLT